MSLPLYQYAALPEPRAIRVIALQPATNVDAPLKCDLNCKLLAEPSLQYEAISYACGKFEPNVSLQINDNSVLYITENLGSALRCFRQKDRPRNLWVDAISINQYNITEKEQQVGMMRDVYPKAVRVLVWLGEEDEKTGPALDLCHDLASKSSAFGIKSIDPLDLPREATQEQVAEVDRLALDETRGRCLTALLFRPCFWRRWIVQEMVLATDVSLYCGGRTIDWTIFSLAVAVLRSCSERRQTFRRVGWLMDPPGTNLPCYFNVWHVILIRTSRHRWKLGQPYQTCWMASLQHPELGVVVRRIWPLGEIDQNHNLNGPASDSSSAVAAWLQPGETVEKHVLLQGNQYRKPINLLQHLLSFGASQVTDPRDGLFSLLGIAEDDPPFEADYQESTQATFLRFARFMLLQHHDLKILHHVEGTETLSYAPMWQSSRMCKPVGGHVPVSYLTAIKRIPRIYDSLADDGIFIGGVEMDRITDLVPLSITTDHQGEMNDVKLVKYLEEVFKFVSETFQVCLIHSNVILKEGTTFLYRRSNELVMEALAQTFLCGNKTREVWSVFPESATISYMGDQLRKAFLAIMLNETRKDGYKSIIHDRNHGLFISAVRIINVGRSFFVTSKGYIGMAPDSCQVGDRVVALFGAETPFILRQVGGRYSPATNIPPSVTESTVSVSFGDDMEYSDPVEFFFGNIKKMFSYSRLTNDTDVTSRVYNDSNDVNADIERFRLIGDCYLHGFMDHVDFSGYEERFFKLI